MKIDPASIQGPGGQAPEAKPAQGTSRAGGDTAARSGTSATRPGGGADHVQLSNLLERLRESSAASPDEAPSADRTAHIEKLTAQVQAGTYEVDSRKLSQRIVDDTLAGLG
jgi:flagellar biosynthesis anti-sigma factor FlgM